MVLGNVERLKIVVRSFHLRPGDHAVTEGEKNSLDLLEGLAQRMPRAKWPQHSRERKIFALAGKRRLVGRGFNRCTLRFELRLDVRFKLVERLADRALSRATC